MPLCLDPNETFELSLSTDAGRSELDRPAFRFHYLSGRAWRKRAALQDEWTKYFATPPDKRSDGEYERLMDLTYSALKDSLAGWSFVTSRDGSPLGFDAELLDDVIGDGEALELLDASARMNRLSVAEKKGSASPSPSATAASVPAAVPPIAGAGPCAASSAFSSASSAPAATPPAPNAPATESGN